MACKVIIKPKAQHDLIAALEWHIQQGGDLAGRLLHSIDDALEKVGNNPTHYQKRYGEIRIILTKKFSYGIYYTYEMDIVFVHAILHVKQDPKHASRRLR